MRTRYNEQQLIEQLNHLTLRNPRENENDLWLDHRGNPRDPLLIFTARTKYPAGKNWSEKWKLMNSLRRNGIITRPFQPGKAQ